MSSLPHLCHTADITNKSGIHISKHIANRTIWDEYAIANFDQPLAQPLADVADDETTAAHLADITSHLDHTSTVLDYGCGYGRLASQLLSTQPVAGYIGLDSSYELLKLFQAHYDQLAMPPSTPLLLLNADINQPPLKKDTIDLAVVVAVFRHNHKSVVRQSIHELARVVKPGGKVVVYAGFPRVCSLRGVAGQFYQIGLNLFGRPFKNGPVRYYTRREVKRLFCDFSAVQLKPVGYSVLPSTLSVLPPSLQPGWRKAVATPINTLLEKLTPAFLQPYFATHIDVVARR
jgi:SAM-dependent methyltransferase